MRIALKFTSRDDAFAFYKSIRAIPRGGKVEHLTGYFATQGFDLEEIRELCFLASVYAAGEQWIAYLEVDDEFGENARGITEALAELCRHGGLAFTAEHPQVPAAGQAFDRMQWPVSEIVEEVPLKTTRFTHEIVIALQGTSDEYDGRALSNHQRVECIKYWHECAGIPYEDMEMFLFSLSADGEKQVESFDDLARYLHGHAGAQAAQVIHRPLSGASPEQRSRIRQLIHETVGAVIGAEQLGESNYSGRENGVTLLTDTGVSIIFGTVSPVTQEQQERLVERFKATYLYDFVRKMYLNLFQSETVMLWAGDDVGLEPASTGSEPLSLTLALQASGAALSAVKMNKCLVEKGILKAVKKRGAKTPLKIFTEDSEGIYGVNVQKSHRKNDMEARYYIEPFQYLLDLCIE